MGAYHGCFWRGPAHAFSYLQQSRSPSSALGEALRKEGLMDLLSSLNTLNKPISLLKSSSPTAMLLVILEDLASLDHESSRQGCTTPSTTTIKYTRARTSNSQSFRKPDPAVVLTSVRRRTRTVRSQKHTGRSEITTYRFSRKGTPMLLISDGIAARQAWQEQCSLTTTWRPQQWRTRNGALLLRGLLVGVSIS